MVPGYWKISKILQIFWHCPGQTRLFRACLRSAPLNINGLRIGSPDLTIERTFKITISLVVSGQKKPYKARVSFAKAATR
jgi:hypothetical protein